MLILNAAFLEVQLPHFDCRVSCLLLLVVLLVFGGSLQDACGNLLFLVFGFVFIFCFDFIV